MRLSRSSRSKRPPHPMLAVRPETSGTVAASRFAATTLATKVKSRRLPPVAIDDWCCALERRCDESGDDRGVLRQWVLARSEHVEVAQHHRCPAMELTQSVNVMFGGGLAGRYGDRGSGRCMSRASEAPDSLP